MNNDNRLLRTVGKNNKTSGKVTLPIAWIGSKVEIKLMDKSAQDKPTPMPIISAPIEIESSKHTTIAVIKQPVVERTTCINHKSGICTLVTIGNNYVSCFGHKSKCEHPGLYKEL